MRVPVYERQVEPQIPTVRSQVQLPSGATGVALQPVDTSRGLLRGAEALRAGLLKMQENQEQFQLASAVNEFRRANTEYLHEKDTGVFALKGGDVFGVSERYDEYAQKTMDNIARRYKMNDRVKQAFIGSTNALRDSSLSSVMRYESRETDAAREAAWKATAAASLDNVALVWADDNAFNEEYDMGMGAVAQQYAPYGDKVVSQKLKEFSSRCHGARVEAMLEEDPRGAEVYLKGHEGEFTGIDLLKLKKAVGDRMEVIKVQEAADGIMRRFADEGAALSYVRNRYEGERENKLVSEVKRRFGEAESRKRAAEGERSRAQDEMYRSYWRRIEGGEFFTEDDLAANGLRPDQVSLLLGKQELKRKRRSIEGGLKAQDPLFSALPEGEREVRVRRRAGITDEQHDRALVATYDQLLAGEIGMGEVRDRVDRALLSPSEARQMETALKELDDAQKSFVRMETKRFNEVLKDYESNGNGQFDTEGAAQWFADRVMAIPANAKDYRQQVKELGRDALVRMIDTSGAALNGVLWGRSDWGEKRDELADAEYGSVQEYMPREPKAVHEARTGKAPPKTREALRGALGLKD
ncbi:MAG: hypothetical protein ACOYD9_07365 [Pyramidobacter sp.]|jgi:hypothetical protein